MALELRVAHYALTQELFLPSGMPGSSQHSLPSVR